VTGWLRAPFRLKPELQEKPGILVSNYGNFLYDDMIGMMLGPVRPYVLVRDSFYRFPLLKPMFKFFRTVPIARSNDPYFTPERRKEFNEKTFEKISGLLRKGNWFSIFPETKPGHRSKLEPGLKPGVAHVALKAEDAAGWSLGLNIYVYGSNYENKLVGRSRVYLRWAAPIAVAKYRDVFRKSPVEAVDRLMAEIEQALHSVVLEAKTLDELADAYRLASQRRRLGFDGVQDALREVQAGSSSPEDLRRIVCRRGRESVLYQLLGYAMLGISTVIGWPFRTFGKLCAAETSEEMTYQFLLWGLVLVTGVAVNGVYWAKLQLVATWISMAIWLWAWRRGVIEAS
jgi:1-acyl-sn-glycerol-3-phosphate acyltransferase